MGTEVRVLLYMIALYVASGAVVLMVCLLTCWVRRMSTTTANSRNVNVNDADEEEGVGLSTMELEKMPPSLILSCESKTTMTMDDDSECAICLGNMEIGDRYRVLPVCGHWFHDHCIVTWLTKSRTCPLCRASAAATTIDDIV